MKARFFLLLIICIYFSNLNFGQSSIADADNDTKVETDVSSNPNTIRFSTEGTEVLAIEGNRLVPTNTGRSIFIGKNAGLDDDLSNNNGIFIGESAGANNIDGVNNTAIGYEALKSNTTGKENLGIGTFALTKNTTGNDNFALGSNALRFNTTGIQNTGLGRQALYNNTEGNYNTAISYRALYQNTTGLNNIGIGRYANYFNQEGHRNTIIGFEAGKGGDNGVNDLHNKSGCVFIGYKAGYYEKSDDKLYIDNSNTTAPLVYGDFATDFFKVNGTTRVTNELLVGTEDAVAGYKVSVDGKGIFTEVRVSEVANWPDYVFQPDYELAPLEEVNEYIISNGHLPNIPSAEEVEKDGILLGDMQKKMMEKIEELTLYTIQQEQRLKKLEEENKILKQSLLDKK